MYMTISLEPWEINIILHALGDRPYNEVATSSAYTLGTNEVDVTPCSSLTQYNSIFEDVDAWKYNPKTSPVKVNTLIPFCSLNLVEFPQVIPVV